MKVWLIAIAAFILLIGALIGGLFLWVGMSTDAAAKATEGFLDKLVKRDFEQAYTATASDFREAQDKTKFMITVERLSPIGYTLAPWRDRTLKRNNRMIIKGHVEVEGNMAIPFVINCIEEGSEWKVLSFVGPGRTDITAGAWFNQIPSEAVLKDIVTADLLVFDIAIKEDRLGIFYEHMALAFRLEIPLLQFYDAYKHLIENKVDMSAIANVAPVFTEPAAFEIIPQGQVLRVTGYYPISPERINFQIRYRYEHPDWKVYYILLTVGDSEK